MLKYRDEELGAAKLDGVGELQVFLKIDLPRAGQAFTASVSALIPAIFVFLAGQDYLEWGIIAIAIMEYIRQPPHFQNILS